jgi:type I restriction enzyme S subunit
MNADFIIQLMLDMQFSPGRANLSMSNLAKFCIALPPLNEQKEIVKKVENLFAICDQLEEQITSSQTNAEQLMQSVLKEAFSQESAA